MAFLQHLYCTFLVLLIWNVPLILCNKCHVGWSFQPSTGYCYGAIAGNTLSITWTNAESMCQTFGGHIVTAENLTEFRHILSYFHVSWRNTWFGNWADDLNHGRWNSIDGTVTDFWKYSRWCVTHPWTKFSGRRCVGLGWDGTSVCFFDQNCVTDDNMQVVCKAPPISISPQKRMPKYGCKLGWSYLPSTGYCYGANAGSTLSITWQDGENICQSSGGHLVTVENIVEYRHVVSYFHVSWRNTWFGVYTNNLAGGIFESLDGTPVDFIKYSRWCLSHPWKHLPGKRCIGLGWDGVSVCFFDQNCVTDNNMQMLCKAKPTLMEPAAEDPKVPTPDIFEPETNPTIPALPTISTIASTRRMSCRI